MHIPQTTKHTNELTSPQTRLFLVGPPKFGKTWSALTFPNPFVVDFDNGLTASELRDRKIPFAPFYSMDYIKNTIKQQNKTNALNWFLQNEATKFTAEQTLIFDSVSTIGDAVAEDLEKQTPISKTGEKDGFWFWKMWSLWWNGFCTKMIDLKCNVVVIAHEQEIRDSETGKLLSYKWILKGQDFSPRMPQFFTDVFRQVKTTKPSGEGKVELVFQWQVHPTTQFPFACTRMNTKELFVPANYSSFKL